MKDELRKRFKSLRSEFSNSERNEADKLILNNFLSQFGGYKSYFIYNSFGFEADTQKLIAALISLNKQVYMPKVCGKNMLACKYEQGKFIKGAFGINEPIGEVFNGDIQISVVPLLAINSKGYRLGYGGGFYDRYLKDKNTISVGIGYFFQLSDLIIQEEHDVPLNYFVSEKGVIKFDK